MGLRSVQGYNLPHRDRARADAKRSGLLEDNGNIAPEGYHIITEEAEDHVAMRSVTKQDGVSHVPRGPPVCVCLPELDKDAPLTTQSSFPPPDMLPFDDNSRCACGLLLSEAEANGATLERSWSKFIVYTEIHALETLIETTPCPKCRHQKRRIGPDLEKEGLFNWNNKIGFAQELMDEFIS